MYCTKYYLSVPFTSLISVFTMSLLKAVVYLLVGIELSLTQDSANDHMSKLYNALRTQALPNTDSSSSKRLVLISPGQVLNERDYYPGAAYVRYVTNPDSTPVQYIPPVKQLNLFNLVDKVPAPHLIQTDSGERFSVLYRLILGEMDIVGLNELTAQEQIRVNQSLVYLEEHVPDPRDRSRSISRWDLYRRYETLYYDEVQAVDDEISYQRSLRSSVDYQIWFQRQYPVLQSRIDGLYTDWIVNGDKELVTMHRARLGSTSPGSVLGEAKAALRVSGLIALDRSTTIYPIDYTPSNWYNFLKDPVNEMTYDQIQTKLGVIDGQINFLEAIKDYQENGNCTLDDAATLVEEEFADNEGYIASNTTAYLIQRLECFVDTYDELEGSDDCDGLQDTLDSALEAIGITAEQYQALNALSLLNGDSETITETIARLNEERSSLSAKLQNSKSRISSSILGISTNDVQPEDGWVTFSYDTSTSPSYDGIFTTNVPMGETGWVQRRSSSGNSLPAETVEAYSSFDSASFTFSGEILRVFIRYPWFRPSMFKSPYFKTEAQVSPGPPEENENDDDFVRTVVSGNYLIPQYITGLLLMRNITMESQVSPSVASTLLADTSRTDPDISYGPFSLTTRYGSQRPPLTASSSVDSGFSIKVPGTQMVGYYTEILPKFPINE